MKKMLILLFLIGCSQSPLLNHTTAGAMTESFESKLGFPVVKMGFLIEWEAGCPQAGECKLILKSWKYGQGNPNGPYQDFPYELASYLWMRSMGHGSAPVEIKKLKEGVYEISSIQFIMAGDWQLFFQLKDDDKLIDEVFILYRL